MRRNTEDGFVLVSAMWLLLLGAALASLLMLRSMTSARDLKAQDARLLAGEAADDAVERVAAELVFDGPRSRWAQLPANGNMDVDGENLAIRVTAESNVAGVNIAEPRVIDGALQDRGYRSAERVALLDRIGQTRAARHKISSFSEIAGLGQGILAPGAEDCLVTTLSPFGSALPGSGNGGIRIGSVLRITVAAGGSQRVYVLRLITANDRPYALLDDFDNGCQQMHAPGGAA